MYEGRLKVMVVTVCCHVVKGFLQVGWRWKQWLIGLILTVTATLTIGSLWLHCAGLHVSVHHFTLLLMLSATASNNNDIEGSF